MSANPGESCPCGRQDSVVSPRSHREQTSKRVGTSKILFFLLVLGSAKKHLLCPVIIDVAAAITTRGSQTLAIVTSDEVLPYLSVPYDCDIQKEQRCVCGTSGHCWQGPGRDGTAVTRERFSVALREGLLPKHHRHPDSGCKWEKTRQKEGDGGEPQEGDRVRPPLGHFAAARGF